MERDGKNRRERLGSSEFEKGKNLILDKEVDDSVYIPFGLIYVGDSHLTLRKNSDNLVLATLTDKESAKKIYDQVSGNAVASFPNSGIDKLYLRQIELGNPTISKIFRFAVYSKRMINFAARNVYEKISSFDQGDGMTFEFLHHLFLPQSSKEKDSADFVVFNPKNQPSILSIHLKDNGEDTIWFMQPSGHEYKNITKSHLGLYEFMDRLTRELRRIDTPAINEMLKEIEIQREKVITPYETYGPESASFVSVLKLMWENQVLIHTHHLELQRKSIEQIKKDPLMQKLMPWFKKDASNLWGILAPKNHIVTERDWKQLVNERPVMEVQTVTDKQDLRGIMERLGVDRTESRRILDHTSLGAPKRDPWQFKTAPGSSGFRRVNPIMQRDSLNKLLDNLPPPVPMKEPVYYINVKDLVEWEINAIEIMKKYSGTVVFYNKFKEILDIGDNVFPRTMGLSEISSSMKIEELHYIISRLLLSGDLDKITVKRNSNSNRDTTPMPFVAALKDHANNRFNVFSKPGGMVLEHFELLDYRIYENAIKSAGDILVTADRLLAKFRDNGRIREKYSNYAQTLKEKALIERATEILKSQPNNVSFPTHADVLAFAKIAAQKSLLYFSYMMFVFALNNEDYIASGKHKEAITLLRENL